MLTAFLTRITMYRLAVWYLAGMLALAVVLSFAKILPYDPLDIFLQTAVLLAFSLLINSALERMAGADIHHESAIITALILSLIIGPAPLAENFLFLLFLAGVSMIGKYAILFRGVHVFNPAAFAVFISALAVDKGASWWVGSAYLAPAVLVGGILLARKMGRGAMIGSFLLIYLTLTVLLRVPASGIAETPRFIADLLLVSPLLFFAFVMLPEPQTSPRRLRLRVFYGIFVAAVLVLYQQYRTAPYTLELALLVGNLFAAIVSPRIRTVMTLERKEEAASRIISFWFLPKMPFHFLPGQFLEWTVPHKNPDSRGIRRYATVASSPTEKEILLTMKIPENPSSFKKALRELRPGVRATAVGVNGDFILPENTTQKLAWIAGGIGVTPFRSMAHYLLDTHSRSDIILLYAANAPEEFAFTDVFAAAKEAGVRVVYSISNPRRVPANWKGESGPADAVLIQRAIPDWPERLFYVSGPEPMVRAMEKILADLGVEGTKIKRDYFPGYEVL